MNINPPTFTEKTSQGFPSSDAPNHWFLIAIGALAFLGGILFGFVTAIISGAIPYITAYFKLNEYALGGTVGFMLLGCAAGVLPTGFLADKIGRRNTLLVCAVFMVLTGLGAGWSHQWYELVAYRFIGGMGIGAIALIAPLYIAELSPAHLRGRFIAFYQLSIVLGMLFAYFSADTLSHTGENNWRWMFCSQTVICVFFFFLLYMLPETPRWLVKKGLVEEAGRILVLTQSSSGEAAITVSAIQETFVVKTPVSIMQLGRKPYRRILFIGILVAVIQQATGINVFLYYAPRIFDQIGVDAASASLYTIGIGLTIVVSAFLAIGGVDKIGRKKLLLAGLVIMGTSLLVIAGCFQYHYFNNYLLPFFLSIYVGAFSCTLGTVTWIYLAEIFPNHVRGTAMSVAMLGLWLTDFLVTFTFPAMNKLLGMPLTLLCYAGMCAISYFLIRAYVQETKDYSLEEIEVLLKYRLRKKK